MEVGKCGMLQDTISSPALFLLRVMTAQVFDTPVAISVNMWLMTSRQTSFIYPSFGRTVALEELQELSKLYKYSKSGDIKDNSEVVELVRNGHGNSLRYTINSTFPYLRE